MHATVSLRSLFSFLLLSLLGVSRLLGDARCAKIFGDHMVLQRDLPVPVWGEATPGESVTVAFAGQSQTAVADAAGRWRVTLAPLAASAEPRGFSVSATNSFTFTNVLVGEVWFCSGQSNMEKQLGPRKGQRPTDGYELEIVAANFPHLRLFQVPRSNQKPDSPALDQWLTCTPDHLRASEFSAAAYYFGQQVQRTLGVPVGLVHSSFGGTFIEAWMPPSAFAAPPLAGLEKRELQAWVKGVQATELYRDMVAPYVPFALRGFLWYQGETNLMNGDIALYAEKQTALIAAWRSAWERPDAPFFGVLLAPMDYSKWEKFTVTAEALPAFREEQVQAFSEPNTGYVVTTDLVSDLHDTHPINKRDVGLRLARLALGASYSRADIPARGPCFASLEQSDDSRSLELIFEYADGLHTRDGLPPSGFLVAGGDQVFHVATARIESGKVLVFSPDVAVPVAVRLGWHEAATPNLVNAAGLPATPFRTDDWPLTLTRPGSLGAPPAK
jgi:sialate O-acetylesterase